MYFKQISSIAILTLSSLSLNPLALTSAWPLTESEPGPDFFPGPQKGLGSWFRSKNDQDSTDGRSWCGYEYNDDDLLFAPSLKAMGGISDSNTAEWKINTQKYCGLEAKVTDPGTGKTLLL